VTRKRFIGWVIAIAAALSVLGAGLWGYLHYNSGPRIMARAELAIRAGKPDKAVSLAQSYISRFPEDWHGHYLLAEAYCGQGKYAQARAPLAEASRRKPEEVSIVLALARTHSLPAIHALTMPEDRLGSDTIRGAISELMEAVGILTAFQVRDNQDAIRVGEAVGLYYRAQGRAQQTLARRLGDAAKLAEASRSTEIAQARRKESQEALAESRKAFGLAIQALLSALQKDPSRETTAEPLIELCIETDDQESLKTASKAIGLVKDPPPEASMMLAMEELRTAPAPNDAARAKRIDDVIRRLDELLAAHPENISIKLKRAEMAMEKSDLRTAGRLIAEVLAADARNSRARLLQACVLIRQGQTGEAERKLFTLKADLPTWVEAHYWYAVAAEAVGKGELAREAMRTATSLRPAVADTRAQEYLVAAHKYLAAALMDQFPKQAFDDALACYEARPDDPEAMLLFIEAARRTQQSDLARKTLQDALERNAAKPVMVMAISDSYLALDDRPKAIEMARRAIALTPATVAERLAVAQGLIRTDRGSEADKILADEVKADPNSPQAHFAIARRFDATGRDLQALEHYRNAVKLDIRRLSTYRLALARALADIGELEEARDAIKPILATSEPARDMEVQIKVLQGQPPDANALLQDPQAGQQSGLQLALTCLRSGQVQQCVKLCRDELQKHPESFEGRLLLGQAYLSQDKEDECIKQWTPLIALRPTNLPTYVHLASVIGRQADPEQAEKRLAAVPGARQDMVSLAVASLYMQSGQALQAAKLFGQVAASPTSSEAARNRAGLSQALCLSAEGLHDQAIAELDKFLAGKPWPRLTLFAKADLLAKAGRAAQAEAALGELLKTAQAEQNVQDILRVVDAFARIGNRERALATCDCLRDLVPNDPRSYLRRAEILANDGKLDQVAELYQKAIELQPADCGLYVTLARVFDALQEPARAIETLRKLQGFGQTERSIALFHQAGLLARWGLKSEAVRRLESIGPLPSNPQLQLDVGRAFSQLGRKDRAREVLAGIPEYARQYALAQQVLAELADKPDSKLAILRSLAGKKPGYPALVLVKEMSILLDDNRPAEATRAFQSFLASPGAKGRTPVPSGALAVKAAVRAGDLDTAMRTAGMLAAGTGAAQWRGLAIALATDRDPNAAAGLLPKPDQADPIASLLGLCMARKSGDKAASRQWAARLSQAGSQPTDTQPAAGEPQQYELFCALLIADKPRAEAILAKLAPAGGELLHAAQELVGHAAGPDQATDELARLVKARIAFDLGQPELARRWAMEALQARPTCQWAALMLLPGDQGQLQKIADLLVPADCYLAKAIRAMACDTEGQYDKAAAVYAELAKDNPREPGLILRQALVEERAGHLPEALDLYQKAWPATGNPIAANNAAYVTAKLFPTDAAKLADAWKLAEAAMKVSPEPAFRETAGWIAHLQGRHADACRLLREAIKGQPDSAEVHYHLARAEAAAGNRKLARMHVDEAVRIGERLSTAAGGKPSGLELEAARLAKQAQLEIEPIE
jgi:tetratricopeptide (TPR) repeat protein